MICRKDISVSRLEECGVCTGSGVKAGTTASTCSTCGGQGQVVTVQRTPIGAFQQVRILLNSGNSIITIIRTTIMIIVMLNHE